MALRTAAASATVRASGPIVSWVCEIGMTPARLVSPTVGLLPTTPLALAGETIEPFVSVPIATAHRLAAGATPEPELEPPGVRSMAYGLRVCRPRPLQPLDDRVERKFAHSLILVLPSRIAPTALSFAATVASRAGFEPSRASEPA